jgi:hypothetical protein
MPFLFLEKRKKKIDTWDGMCDTYATYEIIMHRLMRPHGIAEKGEKKNGRCLSSLLFYSFIIIAITRQSSLPFPSFYFFNSCFFYIP